MAVLSLKAGRKELKYLSQYFVSFLVQQPRRTELFQTQVMIQQSKRRLIPTQAFSTAEDGEKKPKKDQINYSFQNKIESVGRKIPYPRIQLIDEDGNDMGIIHRVKVLEIMDERGLRLVLLREKADPPVYRLMSGQQIHKERLRLQEKQKASGKSGPVQKKELKLSTEITQHDLNTKLKQIKQWIDNKYHVRITVRQSKASEGPKKMLALFDQILAAMPGKATYLSEPRMANEQSSTCVLRAMSDKEIHQYEKTGKGKEQQDNKNMQETPEDKQNKGKEITDSDALKE